MTPPFPCPTDEQLEEAAVSAETWKEHGDLACRTNYRNKDGFDGPAMCISPSWGLRYKGFAWLNES